MHGASVHAKDSLACAFNSNKKIVDLLLDYGADLHAKDSHSHTALDAACKVNPNPQVVVLLLDRGADQFAKYFNRRNALHQACKNNENPQIVARLLLAAESNSSSLVDTLLLERGADLQVRTNTGETALDLAQNNPNPQNRFPPPRLR